jgi:DNA-directed RNA polymerase specialized sigma24 family protein
MIAPAKLRSRHLAPRVLHAAFLAMLPDIRRHAGIAFRDLNPEAKEEAVQEVTANAFAAFHRLAERGKADVAYPSVLAKYAVAQFHDGRRVGGRLNIRDVSSKYCQVKKGAKLERLDRFDHQKDQWKEIAVEDRRATPADIAATRIDFGAWLDSLPCRYRRIAEELAVGETTGDVAITCRVSAERVSQLRRELKDDWEKVGGDVEECAAAAGC